jgi:hypothetical protein
MSELIPITVAAIVLAILSHRASEYDPIRSRYGRQDRLWFGIMAVAMILFCGLRTGYNDTGTYQSIYNAIAKDVDLLEGINWLKLGENPGFSFTNHVLVRLGFSTQSFLMFYAVVTVGIYLWFLRKYTCQLPLTVFLFVTFCGYTFTLAAIKQCMAMALCMVATDRAIRGKYISFVLWVLLGALYHPYALMYLIVPLLMFRPWSIMTIVMLMVFAVAGMVMEQLLGTILNVTDMLGENYDASSFIGEGVNPFRFAAISVPILVSFLTRKQIAREGNREQNLMVNLAMLNGEIMFLALFGTANYFARLANYFLPFQALAIPWLLSHFEKRSKSLVTTLAIGAYIIFFVYENMYTGGFDGGYSSVTLWEYLASVFN